MVVHLVQQSALAYLIRATAGQLDGLFAQPIFFVSFLPVPEAQGGFPQALSRFK